MRRGLIVLTATSAAFFLSGFAALTYQIAWQRMLVLPMGADVYATTLVVAAFMVGLGAGSLAGGSVADRLTPRQNLLTFVGAEVAIGVFGWFSRQVFYDWHYLSLGSSVDGIARMALVCASLAWPTFWMGVSLPVLARAVSTGTNVAAKRVGTLYGLNTIGAASGALLATWVIVPRVGLEGAMRIAAIVNIIAALSVVALINSLGRDTHAEAEPAAAEHRPLEGTNWGWQTWVALYAVAGFQALSLEIVWFRLLGVMLKASAFTFGTLLTIYLFGLGFGAMLAGPLLNRVRRPALTFLGLQAFVGLYAAGSLTLLVWLLSVDGAMHTLQTYLATYEPMDARLALQGDTTELWRFLALYIALPVGLVGPPTVAMGASFAFVQRIVLVDIGRVGRRVGAVLVANIAGSAAGAVVTGWFALTWLGTPGSLALLSVLSGAFLVIAGVMAARQRPLAWRWAAAATAMSITGVVATQVPSAEVLWAAMHGADPSWVIHREDATGLSLIKTERGSTDARGIVYVNGIGQSWIPYGNIHSVLGALPAFVHPNPRSALLIGLGSGDTLYSLAGRQELSAITSVEIIQPQLQTLNDWHAFSGYPGLTALLGDARVKHVFGDGRIHVMRSEERFDIIEADALRPTSAYAGNLYSTGYFELVRSKLNDTGFAVTWAPTSRIRDTFASVFPHVLAINDILIGSPSPIAFDAEAIRARLEDPAVQTHFNRAGVDIMPLLAPYLAQAPQAVASNREAPPAADLNHDLFPRDEFGVPRAR